MKFLQKFNATSTANQRRVNYSAMPQEDSEANGGNRLLGSLDLRAANDNDTPVLQTNQEAGTGINAPDTVKNFNNRVSEIVTQGSEGAINANLGGSFLSRIFVPPEFKGYTNLYLLNPFFAAPAGFTPASVITTQLKEGFKSLGDPADLLGDSPLLSIKMAKSLVKSNQIEESLKGIKSSRGNLDNMSLTSLQILESVNDEAFETINQINEARAAEFYAKSGYNILTGERDEETGAVWWKRALRKGFAQNLLYRKRVAWAKSRYKEGYDEIRSNIRSLKQSKEESVFGIQQAIDQFLIPRQPEGSANTKELDAGRRVIQLIINKPDEFSKNPSDSNFTINGIEPKDIFGGSFNPLDVLEALRAPNMEFLTSKIDSQNFLDSAITVNHWQLNHYNTLRNLKGLDTRAKALQGFKDTSFQQVEIYLLEQYEPDKDFTANTQNPSALNDEILTALGSAVPGKLQDIQSQIQNGDIYLSPLELFWHIIDFLGKDRTLSALRRLPPKLQGKLAQFMILKRTELEKSAISGGIEEKSSLVWRAEALNQGKLVAQSLGNFANELPNLGEKLISTEKGGAQEALRIFPTLLDNFRLFFKLLGAKPNQDGNFGDIDIDVLLKDVPEYEASLLSNIINLYPKINYIQEVYPKLVEDRKNLEAFIDQDPKWVEAREKEYQEKDVLLKEITRKGESGFGNTAVFGGMGGSGNTPATTADGSSEGAIGTGGGGLEAPWTAIRKDLERLTQFLNSGEDGGAIGKVEKIKNFTFPNLPGNISSNIKRLAAISERTIDRRLKELGLNNPNAVANLLDDDKKPSFDVLARNELFTNGSADIIKTAQSLIGNQVVQQFENMDKCAYVGVQNIMFARADYQPFLTVQSLTNPEVMKEALYVKKDAEGAFWYHTETQVIRITPPRLHDTKDQRNVAVWYKDSTERGLDKKFTIPNTQPDHLGIFLTANPENKAATDNPLYGPVQKKVAALIAANQNFDSNN